MRDAPSACYFLLCTLAQSTHAHTHLRFPVCQFCFLLENKHIHNSRRWGLALSGIYTYRVCANAVGGVMCVYVYCWRLSSMRNWRNQSNVILPSATLFKQTRFEVWSTTLHELAHTHEHIPKRATTLSLLDATTLSSSVSLCVCVVCLYGKCVIQTKPKTAKLQNCHVIKA